MAVHTRKRLAPTTNSTSVILKRNTADSKKVNQQFSTQQYQNVTLEIWLSCKHITQTPIYKKPQTFGMLPVR